MPLAWLLKIIIMRKQVSLLVKLISIGYVLSLLLLLCRRSLLREVYLQAVDSRAMSSQYLFNKTRIHYRRFRMHLAGRAPPTLMLLRTVREGPYPYNVLLICYARG